jgi:hypothetical protein
MGECTRAGEIVRLWEDEGVISPPDLDFVVRHCTACRECASRFSVLVALMERDGRGAPGLTELREPPFSDEMKDRIMARVRSTAPRRMPPRLSWPALAAACSVFAVGIAIAVFAMRAPSPADEVTVHFEVAAPGARSVALVGDFTDWDASRFMMKDADHDGIWQITVHLKKESVAIYNFVIDGSRWIPDPSSTSRIEDGFGGINSVMRL